MAGWIAIPDDVIEFFRSAFAEANRQVTERLLNVPNIRETSLDDALIEALVPASAPRLLPSGAVVEMDIHNIGGLRRLGSWETADIAVLVFVYQGKRLACQKIGFLQSKRLYPENNDVQDEDRVGFLYGMNAFLNRDPNSALTKMHRTFQFSGTCTYSALIAGHKQVQNIETFKGKFGDAIFYLFYNPPAVPQTIRYPVSARQVVMTLDLGCRVYTIKDVDSALSKVDDGRSPTLALIEKSGKKSNWRLETWAADLLLTCKVGEQFDDGQKEKVASLLERRSGPIGAAIAISIALPGD